MTSIRKLPTAALLKELDKRGFIVHLWHTTDITLLASNDGMSLTKPQLSSIKDKIAENPQIAQQALKVIKDQISALKEASK